MKVEHPDYRPFAITTSATDESYVIRLTPTARQADAQTFRTTNQVIERSRQVRDAEHEHDDCRHGGSYIRCGNKGNVPCAGQPPCSPDGKWKANLGSLSLDAGEKNQEFRNVRVSCIAGPCPFSAIEVDHFSHGGRPSLCLFATGRIRSPIFSKPRLPRRWRAN